MVGSGRTLAAQQRAEQLASKFPALLVAAERVATTVAQGVHGRRRVGQGEAFWQFRRYGIGDEANQIDWRQSGKSRFVFVRETEWEAAQSVWLWRDVSPSMEYRSDRNLPTKRERTELLLIALAALMMRGGERFTLLGSDLAPATGRAAFNRLTAKVLEREQTASRATGDGNGDDPSLPPTTPLPRYAQAVLLSDFLAPLDDIENAVMALAGHGIRGQMLQVLDPAEHSLPFRGRVRFNGLEGEGQTLLSRVETVRPDYQGRLDAQVAGLKDIARRLGWDYQYHCTDGSPESALLGLYTAMMPRDKI